MVFYFVQRGETLYAIARRYQTTVHAIVAANRLEDPNAICPGQALIIPRPGEVPSPPPGGIVHLVRPGETVFHLATKFGTSAQDILRSNQIAHPEFILPGQQLVIPEPSEVGEDWPMLGRTAGRVSVSPVAVEGTPLPGWAYTPRKNIGASPSAPVIRYDRVYVGLGDGYYYSLDRKSGRVKWRIPTGGARAIAHIGEYPMATPVVFEGIAYLCGPDGSVFAVDAYTGHQIWKVSVGGPIVSSPAASGGVIYLGCCDEHLYALEAKTGAIAWKLHVGAPIFQPVAIGDEHVYAVTDARRLWAVDAQTGEGFWDVPCEPSATPVYAEVLVIAGGRAHDPKNGQTVWELEGDRATPSVRVDQVLYPSGSVDLFTGSIRWTRGAESGAKSPASNRLPRPEVPILKQVATSTLVLGVGADQRLHAWNVMNGALAWTADLPALSEQPPAVAPGQIVVALDDGSLCTFRLKPERPDPM